MARQAQQKRKLLVVQQLLERQSDEAHPVTMQQILAELEREGIPAERKGIYNDLETLRQQGMDILSTREGGQTGYFLASRTFELPELRLLVDAVQSSRFLTRRKSMELIGKLESLTSVYQARQLHCAVSVSQRIKSMNESIYYNVDEIQTAMAADRQVSFRYFDYDIQRQRVWRRDGAAYFVSPYGLHWDNQNYYLVGYDSQAGELRHYRVDRMANLTVTDQPRTGGPELKKLDMGAYTERVFSMYAGEEASVLLRFRRHLAGAVIDRFGKEAPLTPDGGEYFTTRVTVVVSPQFFGWLCGFGPEVQVLQPAAVAGEYRAYLQSILGSYAPEQEDEHGSQGA